MSEWRLSDEDQRRQDEHAARVVADMRDLTPGEIARLRVIMFGDAVRRPLPVRSVGDLPPMLRGWVEEVGHEGHDLYWMTDGSWIECRTCRQRERERCG